MAVVGTVGRVSVYEDVRIDLEVRAFAKGARSIARGRGGTRPAGAARAATGLDTAQSSKASFERAVGGFREK